jgi:hypothetical protein
VTELAVLQAVRLKGRVKPADLAATLGKDLAEMSRTVEQLAASGLLVEDTTLRISPGGRARLDELLADERKAVDAAALGAAYHDFGSVNTDFKVLVTDWQLIGGPGGQPNTHEDADYDNAVLVGLEQVHERVLPIIAAATAQLPRLGAYSVKLRTALAKVKAGEIAWLTRPLIDSYHTVWFELHEELIQALGMTREEAARSDDAH